LFDEIGGQRSSLVHSFESLPRRSMLKSMAVGAGTLALEPTLLAQVGRSLDPVTARIQGDLEKHASFGSKRSATPGDIETAKWIANRMESMGYKVNSYDFPAPFLVERSVRLSTEGMSLKLYAQTPAAATTGPKGVTGRLALIRTAADAASTKGKI